MFRYDRGQYHKLFHSYPSLVSVSAPPSHTRSLVHFHRSLSLSLLLLLCGVRREAKASSLKLALPCCSLIQAYAEPQPICIVYPPFQATTSSPKHMSRVLACQTASLTLITLVYSDFSSTCSILIFLYSPSDVPLVKCLYTTISGFSFSIHSLAEPVSFTFE